MKEKYKQKFIRASGPGRQNVDKVAMAVQLLFDVANSPSLSDDALKRFKLMARGRITESGGLIIDARRFRSHVANREDAMDRLGGVDPEGRGKVSSSP